MPMISGGTPTAAQATTRASGFLPRARASSPEATTRAAAPSTIPLALPGGHEAVLAERGAQGGEAFEWSCPGGDDRRPPPGPSCVPGRRRRRRSLPRTPRGRGRPPPPAGSAARRRPSASRVMPALAARGCPRSGPWTGRTGCRGGPPSGCPRACPRRGAGRRARPRITCGAWVMFSVPPATATFDSPRRIIWAARHHRLKPRATEAIDGQGGHLEGDAGAQAHVARPVDRVARGLEHVAEDHVVDGVRGDPRALEGGLRRVRPELERRRRP